MDLETALHRCIGGVSIIIPTIAYSSKVQKLVEILQATVHDEIIVVTKSLPRNNESKNVTSGNRVKILEQKGVGRAEACNLGGMYSKGDILVFIDDDCIPFDDGWLSHLVGDFYSDQELGLVSGRNIIPQNSLVQSFIQKMNGLGTPDFGPNDFYIQNEFFSFSGTNMAVRKSTFNKLGGFDENLIVSEDLDFCIRAYQKSVKAKYVSSAIIYHFHRDKVVPLLKHAWKTGKGNKGFIRKYGFWNKFLRGTSMSILGVLSLLPVFFFLIVRIIEPIFLLFLVIPYLIFVTKFWEGKLGLEPFMFPLILALYSSCLGLGLLYQLLRENINENLIHKEM